MTNSSPSQYLNRSPAVANILGLLVPVVHCDSAVHIGHLNQMPSSEKRYSLEGRGISVSHDPSAWRKIARLQGDEFKVSLDQGVFIDMLRATDISLPDFHPCLAAAQEWAIAAGLAERGTTYRVWGTDEEGSEIYSDYTSLDEAEQEVDDLQLIETLSGLLPTPALAERMNLSAAPVILTQEFCLLAFAEDQLKLDGAWWDECLDAPALSAPRGVIFLSTITSKGLSWARANIRRNTPSAEISGP